MKVTGINGSSRKDGNTAIIIGKVFEELCKEGIETELMADVSARMKAFLERGGVVVATNPRLPRHKAGASVAAVRRGGGMTTVDTMNHFMLNKEMIVVGSTYWRSMARTSVM